MGFARSHHRWHSPTLRREMELLVFGHAGARVVVFPTSQGRFYDWEDRGLIGALGEHLSDGRLQIFCVDSVDGESWFAKHLPPADRARRHVEYDHYVLDEVLPFSLEHNADDFLILTGASFGAYHAVNFAFRHPDVVDKTVGFSGKYDIHSFLDGYWNDTAYFHCPTAYVPNMDAEWVERLSQMEICIVTGATDNILSGTTDMIRILREKGIRHRGDVWDAPYGHDWPWWKIQIRNYVP